MQEQKKADPFSGGGGFHGILNPPYLKDKLFLTSLIWFVARSIYIFDK